MPDSKSNYDLLIICIENLNDKKETRPNSFIGCKIEPDFLMVNKLFRGEGDPEFIKVSIETSETIHRSANASVGKAVEIATLPSETPANCVKNKFCYSEEYKAYSGRAIKTFSFACSVGIQLTIT